MSGAAMIALLGAALGAVFALLFKRRGSDRAELGDVVDLTDRLVQTTRAKAEAEDQAAQALAERLTHDAIDQANARADDRPSDLAGYLNGTRRGSQTKPD